MKQLLDGKLAIISPTDGSLCLFSADFHYIERIENRGHTKIEESLNSMVSFGSFGHDANIVLWNCGNNCFCIVDTNCNQLEDIQLNLNPAWQVFCGLTVAGGKKAVVQWKATEGLYGVSYWERSSYKPLAPCKKTCKELDNRCNLHLHSIEPDIDRH
jgi:hypothetical protein